MMPRLGGVRCLFFCLVAACLFGLWSPPAEGSHFAYGTISWIYPRANGPVYFNVEMAFRYGFFGNPRLGSSVNVGALYVPAASGTAYVSINHVVEELNTADDPDWFIGWTNMSYTPPAATGKRFSVYYYNCCRLSNLLERNNDQNVYLYSEVDLNTRTRSPITTGLPREYFLVNAPIGYNTPAVSPDGFGLRFQLSTYALSDLPVPVPCGQTGHAYPYTTCLNAGALTISQATGALSWTPRVAGLYALQIIINDGSINTYLDFLVQIMTTCPQCARPPAFDPVPPASASLYAGVEYVLNVRAVDPNAANLVTVVNTVLPDTATFTQTVTGNPTTYQLRWTPAIDQISSVVCFKARNSQGLYSYNNTCTNLNIVPADYIIVTGMIRNFQATHADFARPASTSTVTQTQFLQSTLTADSKPQLIAGQTSVSNFGQWFTDVAGVNQNLLHTVTLVQGTNPRARVFTFDSNSFLPVNGLLYGASTPTANNLYYTYEIHTYIEYLGGETYNFASSDDMWVFVNNRLLPNWNLQGVHARMSYALVMDSIALSYGLTRGSNYKVDIFYAHRQAANAQGTNLPSFKLELSNSTTCNAITLISQDSSLLSVSTVFSYDTIPTNAVTFANSFATNGKSAQSGAAIRLMSQSFPSESGSVWAAVGGAARAYNVLNGFQVKFSFRITKAAGKTAEGFAFVLQSQSPTARGGEGGNLGYSGITNSVAIEFDALQTSGKSDPQYQHISLHTNYAGANDALESPAYYPPGSSYVGNLPNLPFGFDNGTVHNVVVDFTPSATSYWVNVFMNANILPVFSAAIDPARLASAFSGAAYVGFTASSGDLSAAHVDILSWSMVVVPPIASASTLVSAPSPSVAGVATAVTVQLRDACQNPLSSGGQASLFSASLTYSGSLRNPASPVTITDLNNGRYVFTYAPTTSGQYALQIRFQTRPSVPEPISGGPWIPVVSPAVTSPVTTTYEFGLLPRRLPQRRRGLRPRLPRRGGRRHARRLRLLVRGALRLCPAHQHDAGLLDVVQQLPDADVLCLRDHQPDHHHALRRGREHGPQHHGDHLRPLGAQRGDVPGHGQHRPHRPPHGHEHLHAPRVPGQPH